MFDKVQRFFKNLINAIARKTGCCGYYTYSNEGLDGVGRLGKRKPHSVEFKDATREQRISNSIREKIRAFELSQ